MFEALVNAFACQQLSLVVGLELLNRLAAVCDVRPRAGESAQYAFPAARDVARIAPAKYHAIGFSRQKVRALLTLARRIDRGDVDVEGLACDGDEEAAAHLRELRGLGRWTAEYVLLRGLGRLHVFPGDDIGAQKSLARWLGRSGPLDYEGVGRAAERWRPYAGMLYFHLRLDGLARAGSLDARGRSTRTERTPPHRVFQSRSRHSQTVVSSADEIPRLHSPRAGWRRDLVENHVSSNVEQHTAPRKARHLVKRTSRNSESMGSVPPVTVPSRS